MSREWRFVRLEIVFRRWRCGFHGHVGSRWRRTTTQVWRGNCHARHRTGLLKRCSQFFRAIDYYNCLWWVNIRSVLQGCYCTIFMSSLFFLLSPSPFHLPFQFVQFSDYCVSERSQSAGSTLFVQNQAKLAKAVLAEVPSQLTEFMKFRSIVPPNQNVSA